MKHQNHTTINQVFVFLEIFEKEGGIQSYVKNLLDAYRSLNSQTEHEIAADVFLLRDKPGCDNPLDSYPLKFHYLKSPHPKLGRLRLSAALLQCLWQQRPNHVFCGHINLAPLIQLLCQPLGVPYTILTYGKEVWNRLPSLQHQALNSATEIWTISRYSRDRACAANNLDPQKVKIFTCMVDGNAFTPGTKPPALIQNYGLEGAKVLMTVARLWSGDIYKGVDVTIRALPAIAQVFPEVKYLVIGRGDDQPRLAGLAQELGIADRVVFAGFVPTSDLADHYRVADAYIMPSQEGFGIVYLEAMACGKPVLAGNADGSADPLQDGRLGWQVPHRNPEAVAAACIEILKGEDLRCNGEWLREQCLAQFSQDAFRERLNQLVNTTAAAIPTKAIRRSPSQVEANVD
ncbi:MULTISPECIES: glycosyltransferase family 4 protein [unclassified Coleofasciculus]|uniref:glycosyltransferase family 4 protein n=1 Tax=unclassified Coleofasciculus TaxID=2692782 RepID=UPI001881FEE5|nr:MULTISPECIES: glycosyltransferase family 4 protein [unclassified Coleofasciculus]MBE9126404.1 glycosyltransferase family 4 protein [Coleofasciculus sp. LEGE 07081]MBE9149817.1 glycosyltransferase family 4 protein [Coleofasciculus sp. LEGE 07092]